MEMVANRARQPTRRERCGCNRHLPCSYWPSLSRLVRQEGVSLRSMPEGK
jgi:hypothetical protein